jgi:hypothetical protein
VITGSTTTAQLRTVKEFSIPENGEISLRIPLTLLVSYLRGRAIAQTVSLQLPAAAARVRSQSGHVGFVVTKWQWGKLSPSTSVSLANYFGYLLV